MSNTLAVVLGDHLRNIRDERGLLLSDVSQKIGRSGPTLSRIENGQQACDLLLFVRICQVYKLNPGIELAKVIAEVEHSNEASLFHDLGSYITHINLILKSRKKK